MLSVREQIRADVDEARAKRRVPSGRTARINYLRWRACALTDRRLFGADLPQDAVVFLT